jgi:hypothetical protein
VLRKMDEIIKEKRLKWTNLNGLKKGNPYAKNFGIIALKKSHIVQTV